MRQQILLDMDGVLSDFLSGAIEALNMKYDKKITLDQYAREFGKWGTYDYYGITEREFWDAISSRPRFWFNLDPIPWAGQLYSILSEMGDVTILTSPSLDPNCAKEKLEWLDYHLGVKSSSVFIGSRKYLMAGNGILIDDYHKNCEKFIEAGGEAILVPSVWNTPDLTYEMVMNIILGRI